MKVIAESAYNHQGNFNYLKELAQAAKNSGADYFTVQMMNVEEFCTKEYSKYQLYKDTEFTTNQWVELFDYCKTINVGIDTIQKTNNGVSFTLYRSGIPMPLDVQVTYKDGSTQRFHIPLDLTNNVKKEFKTPPIILQPWSCGAPRYTVSLENRKLSEVISIEVDPDGYLPDDKLDNLYEK